MSEQQQISLIQIKLKRAQLVAQMPSDEDFEALIEAQEAAEREQRSAHIEALARLDAAIAGAEA